MSELSDRIAKCVKVSGLTQAAFAKRINISAAFISYLCSGKKTPRERTMLDICREFRVDEQWLKTGEGEMFPPENPDEEFDRVCTQIQLSDDAFIKELLKIYWGLSDEHKRFVKDKIIELSDAIKKERQ